jgi:serine/threonine protein kinase
MRRLEEELRQERQGGIVLVHVEFSDGDPRLQITGDFDDINGVAATLVNVGLVVCKEVKNDDLKGRWGSRQAEIYHRISTGTLVQHFYGIAELHGSRYAVMEDLREGLTMAMAIESNQLPEPLTRLRLAYEIANTVAYLHSVGIIIKNISDNNIVLKKGGEGMQFRPCLTNLEEARLVSDSFECRVLHS